MINFNEDDIEYFNENEIEEESDGFKLEEDGTYTLPLDLSDEDRILVFQAFMTKHNFNSCSIKTFNSVINESFNIDKAISDAVINEFMLNSLEDKILELKNKVEV